MEEVNQNQQKVTPQAPKIVKPILKPVFQKKDIKKNLLLIGGIILLVFGGVGTGWLLSGSKKGGSKGSIISPDSGADLKEAGFADESMFSVSEEGMLEEEGIGGEGTHHLVRDDDPSHNIYLTSTVFDLQGYVGKKVRIWGDTMSSKEAGWLVDVGKIRQLD
ncbi:hypothetical protein ACFL15_01535 [Patescibacteria group bacterium]